MKEETKNIVRKMAAKLLLAALLLVGLNAIYRHSLYEKDLQENCTLMSRSLLPLEERSDLVYLGESSNHTHASTDTDTSYICDMLARMLPSLKCSNLSKSACHAGVYYDILRNIPKESMVKIAVVTVNMRSLSSEWIYSKLEPALQKEQTMMKPTPPLYQRAMLAFKGYANWSEKENQRLVVAGLKRQRIPLAGFPYENAKEWDTHMAEYLGRNIGLDTLELTCHYVKDFAYALDQRNPRIKDLDNIVALCRKRGWQPVFHILPDNVDQIGALLGNDLIRILDSNADFVTHRYASQGVIVVNNLHEARDSCFIDRTFPTEHYTQEGRFAVAKAIAGAIRSQYPIPSPQES